MYPSEQEIPCFLKCEIIMSPSENLVNFPLCLFHFNTFDFFLSFFLSFKQYNSFIIHWIKIQIPV